MLDKIAELEKLVETQNTRFFPISQKVMVASSGGADSTALFQIFRHFHQAKKISELAVCHVNFGLRGDESEGDESFIRSQCDCAGVPLFVKKVSEIHATKSKGESTQEWARRLRYDFFREFIASGWTIVLAHHQDDLAENFLLRAARGTSPIAAGGMSQWHGHFWRPFLLLPKSALKEWLGRQHLPHREDSSNAKMDYSRNVLRHKVMSELEQLFPGALTRMARLAREAEEISAFTLRALESKFADQEAISVEEIRNYPDGVLKLLLTRLTGKHDSSSYRKFDSNFLDQAIAAIRYGKGKFVRDVPGGGLIHLQDGAIRFVATKLPVAGKHSGTLGLIDQQLVIGARSRIQAALPSGDMLEVESQDAVPQQSIAIALHTPNSTPRTAEHENSSNDCRALDKVPCSPSQGANSCFQSSAGVLRSSVNLGPWWKSDQKIDLRAQCNGASQRIAVAVTRNFSVFSRKST